MNNYRNTILLGLSLVLMLALITVTGCQQEDSKERTLMVGNTTLLYDTSRVQPEMPEKLGRYLLKYYDLQLDSTVKLDYVANVYQYSVTREEQHLDDPDHHFNASLAAAELSYRVFDKAETELHLCDVQFNRCAVVEAFAYLAETEAMLIYDSAVVDSDTAEEFFRFLSDDIPLLTDDSQFFLGYEENRWRFGMAVFEDFWEDPFTEHFASYLGGILSLLFFSGEDIEVLITTDWLEQKKVLEAYPEYRWAYSDQHFIIYYDRNILSEQKAAALAAYLYENGFAPSEQMSLCLTQKEGKWIFRMIVSQSLREDPGFIEIAEDMANQLSTDFLNEEKVVVELCDDVFWPSVRVESTEQ